MATQPNVTLRIGAELAELRGALRQGLNELQKFRDQANRAPAGKGFDSLRKSVDGARLSVASFVKTLLTIGAAMGTIRLADEFANMQARLRLVTDSTEEFIAVQERLFAISQKTGQSFTEITDLYVKLARATKEAGTSQEALLQVTETINQAVQLSGVSAEAANAALIQLGQGLASGTLRGDELRSVMEQVPVLADAIAKGMGITLGELREFGKEGKITGDAVIQALLSQREAIDAQARQLPLTFGRAMTQMRNSLSLFVGELDQAAGGTQGLAGAVQDFANFLSSDGVRGAVAELGVIWGQSIRQIAQDFAQMIGIVNDQTGGLVDFLGRAFMELPLNIRTAVQLIVVNFGANLDELIAVAKAKFAALKAVFTDDTIDDVEARLRSEIARIESVRKDMVGDILTERDKVLAEAKRRAEQARKDRAAAVAAGTGEVKVGSGKVASKFKMAELQKEADESFRILKDALDRETKALDQALEDRKITIADWYAEKERLAKASFDNEKARLERERGQIERHLATLGKTAAKGDDRDKVLKETLKTKNDLEKINADILILERERAETLGNIQREAAQKEKEYQRLLESTRTALLRAQGKDLEARLAEISEARDRFIRESAQDFEGIDLANQLFNAETLKARTDDVQTKISESFSRYEEEAKQMADKVELGIVGQFDAEKRLQQVRSESIAQLNGYISELEVLAESASDIARPELLQRIEAAKIKIQQMQSEQSKLLTDMKDAGKDSLAGFFEDMVEGSKSVGDALKDLVLNFSRAVGKMAAEAAAQNIMASLFKTPAGGGAGGFMQQAFSWFAGLFHSGGIVGHGGRGRMVPAFAFAGAPRYHGGGMVGFAPNEVPAVLKKGEEVLTEGDPRHAANGGKGGGYRIINVVDPSLVEDYMTSSSGEQQILNVIGRNPGFVKQTLGG